MGGTEGPMGRAMIGFPDWAVAAMLLAGGVGVLSLLYSLSTLIRNHCAMHDLKVRVNSLRIEYQASLRARQEAAEIGEVELSDVEVVGNAKPTPAKKAA